MRAGPICVGLGAVAAMLALAGCQTTATQPSGDKVAACTAEVVKKYGVTPAEVATSNEYPYMEGTGVDGSATPADGSIKRFRCEFDKAGALTRVSDLPAGQ